MNIKLSNLEDSRIGGPDLFHARAWIGRDCGGPHHGASCAQRDLCGRRVRDLDAPFHAVKRTLEEGGSHQVDVRRGVG